MTVGMTISCDWRGCDEQQPTGEPTSELARAYGRALGWATAPYTGSDLCPLHVTEGRARR